MTAPGNSRRGCPRLRSNRARREHRLLRALGIWDESCLITLTCPPNKPRSVKWMKRAWRDTVEAEELLTGERVRFAFCANRGKSGNNTHASAHVVMETPVSDELLDRLKRRWREKWGKWQRSSAGDKATVYWANNAVQKNAEIVHWQAPIWDDGAPGDGGLEIRMVHRRPTKEAQEGAVWLAQNDVPLPYKPLFAFRKKHCV